MSLEDVVNVQISGDAPAITRAGFGVPLIAAYHTHNTDRVRSYTSLTAMAADGFATSEPAYQMASVIFSQQPRVPRIRVGRRATAFAQVIHLTPSAPATGDVYSVEINGQAGSYTAVGGDDIAAVCTALATALNALSGADADAIITSRASPGTTLTLTVVGLNGVIGARTMNPPRALSLTLSNHANWDATTATSRAPTPTGAPSARPSRSPTAATPRSKGPSCSAPSPRW